MKERIKRKEDEINTEKRKMLTEEFVSATCGPPLSSNTTITKHIGVYMQVLNPTYAVNSTFKNSSAPISCVAVSESDVWW